jgi:Na(+)-translocating NADH:ubiquinone oxidoreductase B subunit
MKPLLRLFGKLRPLFEKGAKLHSHKPVFDATENFFFAPLAQTGGAPHVRDPLDVKRFMTMVIIALAPCIFAGVYLFGLRVLAMIVVSYAAGGAVETIFAIVRKEEINEGFLVTGLIFPLILPPALPLWMVAVGVAFGVLVGKELFGGTGRNLFNPALVGRCFLALGYPKAMSAAWIAPGSGLTGRVLEYVGADAVTAATPLVQAKQGVLVESMDLFFGNVAGSVGETSALAIIAGGLFLLMTRVANWRTVAGTLGSFALLGVALRALRPDLFGPVGWHLCAGGLLFGAFFMATDPVTSPVTNGGKWVYGAMIGTLVLLIRSLTGYVEGVMFAILIGNTTAPLLDEVAVKLKLRRLRNEK